jgi:hypothetical protein
MPSDAMSGLSPVPEHLHTVTPRLVVRNGAAAIDFYVRAFAAREIGERFVDPEGRLIHAELQIGDSVEELRRRRACEGATVARRGHQRDHGHLLGGGGRRLGACRHRRRRGRLPTGRSVLRRARRPTARPLWPAMDAQSADRAALPRGDGAPGCKLLQLHGLNRHHQPQTRPRSPLGSAHWGSVAPGAEMPELSSEQVRGTRRNRRRWRRSSPAEGTRPLRSGLPTPPVEPP